MKKVLHSFLCLCLFIPLLLVPNNIKAEEASSKFVFTRDIFNKDEADKVIPDNELWYISENAGIRGEVKLPFINNDNEREYKIIGMETSNPDAIQDIEVVDYFYDDSLGKYVNFKVKAVKDEAFTLTLILKKGEETIRVTSEEMIAKHKDLEVFVRRESTDITESEDLFEKNLDEILTEEVATSFQLNHVYYVYAEIGGYDFSKVQCDFAYFVNGKPVYAGMRQDNDIFTSYGLYYDPEEQMTRNAWSAPLSVISVLAKQETQLSIQVGQSYYNFPELDYLMDAQEIYFSDYKEMKDETGNVQVNAQAGVLPGSAQLHVKDVTKGETVVKAMQDIAQNYAAYDISIVSNGVAIQPNGKVNVRIKIPAGMNKDALDVYYVDTNGKHTLLESYLLNDEIIFETDHFSTYVIAERKQQNGGNEEIKDAVVGNVDGEDDPMKNTSAQVDTKSVQMLMMSIIIGCGLCFVGKRVKD